MLYQNLVKANAERSAKGREIIAAKFIENPGISARSLRAIGYKTNSKRLRVIRAELEASRAICRYVIRNGARQDGSGKGKHREHDAGNCPKCADAK